MEVLENSAEVVAISNDPPAERAKTNSLVNGRVRLLLDADLRVTKALEMEMVGGGMPAMGYVVVDGEGQIVAREVDPLFGYNVPEIRAVLQPR